MRTRVLGWPSPSMLVAFAAPVIARGVRNCAAPQLPGGSVGAKQLKRHAVAPIKAVRSTVKLSASQPGPTRDPALRGEPRPKRDPGITRLFSRQAKTSGTGEVTAQVCCRAGERVGGGRISAPGLMAESASDAASGAPPAQVGSHRLDDAAAGEFVRVAVALCAS
jgi:hypothetical protein